MNVLLESLLKKFLHHLLPFHVTYFVIFVLKCLCGWLKSNFTTSLMIKRHKTVAHVNPLFAYELSLYVFNCTSSWSAIQMKDAVVIWCFFFSAVLRNKTFCHLLRNRPLFTVLQCLQNFHFLLLTQVACLCVTSKVIFSFWILSCRLLKLHSIDFYTAQNQCTLQHSNSEMQI